MQKTTPSSGLTTRLPATLLVAAALLFLLLRTIGLHHGSPPVTFHADERHYAGVATRMDGGDLNPHRFENPPLFTYVLHGARRLHELWMGDYLTQRWVAGGGLYLLARWISALLGMATAFVVAATARRLWGGRRLAVAAAVVVGLSFLHGRDSHYGVNDVPMVFAVSVSLLFAVRVATGGSQAWAYASAAVAGLAAATKYNGAVAVVLAPAALLLRDGGGGGLSDGLRHGLRTVLRHGLFLGATAVLAFVAANPYSLLAWQEFRDGFVNQYTRWGDNAIWGQSKAPGVLLYGEASVALLGWAHLAAALVGLGVLARREPKTALLLLAFSVLYLAGMLSKTLFFWRFALPLLPFAALLAARGWLALVAVVVPERRRTLALGLALAAASAYPVAQLVRHDVLLTRPHTWILARDWMLANIPPGSNLFLEGYPPSFPPEYTVYLPRQHVDKLHILQTKAGADGRTRAAVADGGWLVLNSFHEAGWQGEDPALADSRLAFYAKLRERIRLVAEFSPGPHGDPQPFVLDGLYSPLDDLWSVERPGHTIRIYKIEPGEWLDKMLR